MNLVRLTHYFTFFNKLGGVETLLKQHLAKDRDWGIDPHVVAFFEPRTIQNPAVTGVGFTWRDCVRSARRKYHRIAPSIGTPIALYHNFWGIPLVADFDQTTRRLALLHSDWPNIDDTLRAQTKLVDGVVCVNEPLKQQVLEALPELAGDRVIVTPLPISPPRIAVDHPPLRQRPIVCGFSGRVVKEQKRVDLLPRLFQSLDAAGLDYQFEVLGSGPEQKWLERQVGGNAKVRVHGRKTGEEYWRTLAGWDAIVFLSDFEGLPISLLEALSLGVLPIYPAIRSGGDAYAQKVRPDLLYPARDFACVAKLLSEIQRAPEAEIQSLRETCRRLADPHIGDAYIERYSELVHQVAAWPRISSSNLPPRPWYVSDFIPFGLMRRIYLRGFYKPNYRGAIMNDLPNVA